jgi:protocatechuate 3,4-dioxygenase beta subunit
MNLVLDYESSALAAPQSFLNAMQTAVNILDSTILNNITVTIQVGYNDFYNNMITGLGASAEGSDLSGTFVSYTTLRAALASHETSTLDQTFVNSLPTTSSVNGTSGFYVPSAIEKALGMISPTAPGIDGVVGIGSGIPTSDLVGVALHELTHAMGREPGAGTFDLGRYTSPGVHLFSSGSTAPASYFSVDGGVTKLADYGQNSDPSDMLNSGVQGANDPFNEFYSGSTIQGLTTVDKQQLDALGFNVTPSATGTPSTTTSSLIASSPTVTANGTSTTTLTVTVKDASGNVVAGTAVTLSGSGTANSFGAISGTTDANGVFKTTLASTLAQNETITATEGGVQEQTSVSFVAGAPSATTSSLVANAPTVAADGTTTTTLTVTVEDANGNAVAGTAVTLSGSGSANNFGAISGTTNANGVFTTTLASSLVQNETITATEGSVSEHTSVSFVAGGPSAATSSIVASSPTVTADGISTTTLTVTVEDTQGHAVAGTAVTLSGSGSANNFGAISGTTNANGVFTTTLASSLVQNEIITATEGSAQEHTSVSFVAGAPSAATSSLVASSPTATANGTLTTTLPVTADGTSTTTLTVTVEDAHGNAVAGTAVTLSGSGSSNSFGAVSGTTDANGVFTTTLASTLAQNETVTATEGGVQEITSVSFVAGAPSAATSSLVAGSPTVTADGTSTTTLTVTVEDAHGNAVANTAVTLSGSGSSNNFGAISGTTNANGVFTTTLASTLVQNETITATEGSAQEHTSVSFVPPAMTGTVIQTDGSTSLTQVGTNYFLDNAGSGPELKSAGSPVTAGEFGGWTPIGAVQTTSGYDVAWKVAGADQYSVWSTDSNGNYISNNVANINGAVSGTNWALQTIETVFHQDLNGDGVIGIPSVSGTVIQTDGSTSLTQVGTNYFLDNAGSGPELKSAGSPVTAGEFGGWTPIGAVQTASGYDVAWKVAGADQYSVWSTDSNGNYISNNVANINGAVSGTNTALESIETIFHQDLNGDGVVGVPSVSGTVIQTDGSTSLTQVGTNYFLYDAGSGPELKSAGSPVTAGEFGDWTPIGAVHTASGYDVAWKDLTTGQYSVWTTDSNGNYLSNNVANINGAVSGTNMALESIETTFHQDLNGDGVIGIAPVATSPVATNQAAAAPAVGSGTVNVAAPGSGGSFVFDPNFGHVTITNDIVSAGIDVSHAVFADINALLTAAKDDGHGNVIITDAIHDTLTIQNMTTLQLHANQHDFHIV